MPCAAGAIQHKQLSKDTLTFDEQNIARRIASGDQQASRALYDHTVAHMASVCGRYVSNPEDVRDVLQEAYIDIFGRIDAFHFRGEGSLRAWMARVVANKAIDFLRQKMKTDEFIVTDTLPDVPDALPDDDVDIGGVSADVVYEMIRQLPPGYRAVFNLFVFEHLTHREIAQRLGIRENSSASQFHRAKALLAERIRQYQSTHQTTS